MIVHLSVCVVRTTVTRHFMVHLEITLCPEPCRKDRLCRKSMTTKRTATALQPAALN